ncbi:hypothetical protein ACWGIB_03640 [Streptomyces xiamenensis]
MTAALSLPVIVLSMVPARQFTHWRWLCFVLTAPVVVGSAHPFHAATVRGSRHSSASMDTLVPLGVTVSFHGCVRTAPPTRAPHRPPVRWTTTESDWH